MMIVYELRAVQEADGNQRQPIAATLTYPSGELKRPALQVIHHRRPVDLELLGQLTNRQTSLPAFAELLHLSQFQPVVNLSASLGGLATLRCILIS
jgi:hypothetical protein